MRAKTLVKYEVPAREIAFSLDLATALEQFSAKPMNLEPLFNEKHLSKGLRPHAAGPLFFCGMVATRRSGYVRAGH